MDLFGKKSKPTLQEFEDLALRQGYHQVAGVDEAGRGALAGPVVAAAVMLPQGLRIPGVDDSKKLSAAKRDELFDVIMELCHCCRSWRMRSLPDQQDQYSAGLAAGYEGGSFDAFFSSGPASG